jgi:SAM-dependent methyltransferase
MLSPAEQGFVEDYKKFLQASQTTAPRFRLDWNERFPCLNDRTPSTDFDRHYLYHTAWAARLMREIEPKQHIDIGSSLFFSALVSAFIPVRFLDYRPPVLELSNLKVEHADLLKLPFETNSIESLSCMHVIEHIGLGRYGDPIDYDGDLKAISELKRVVSPGGHLLFVVPIGQARIQFNAHRIYDFAQIRKLFSDFRLKEFSLIPDLQSDGGLIRHASEELSNKQSYGCGCFWFVK